MQFKVFVDNKLIGESELENGDPPMGVAFGKFHPTAAYWTHQEIFKKQDYPAIKRLNITVKDANGEILQPCSGVGIIDYSDENTDIEINVLGLDFDIYKKLFPHHISNYRARLND